MALPKFNEIRIQALRILSDGETRKTKDFVAPLAKYFNLTEGEVDAMYVSGGGNVFYNRIAWALSYLYLSGLVDKPMRGVFQIGKKGVELLKTKTPDQINSYVETQVQARTVHKHKNSDLGADSAEPENMTPKESLYRSFGKIKESVYTEILNTIISKTPREFERLVVKLLQVMGYGGEIKDSGYVTKATKDGGIDGIIKEDILGFGRIYIQAKRYALDHAVSCEEVQKFVGALAVAQSNKGVFITTSYFSSTAVRYVKDLNSSTTIVLINGKELAEYIYGFGLGMQCEQTIEIKKLDSDFWDVMEDDQNCKKSF